MENENSVGKAEEDISRPVYIKDVDPIPESTKAVYSREDLEQIVEAPLIKACQELYDKNIRTIMSSANFHNINEGHGLITLRYDDLTEENKQVFAQLIQEGLATILRDFGRSGSIAHHILVPLDENSTVQEVEAKALEIVERFLTQEAPLNSYTLDEMRQVHGGKNLTIDEVLERDPLVYYDAKSGLFCLK